MKNSININKPVLKKTEVIKHSAAIQITNRVSLLQRRTWNILLAQAFDNLLEKEEHQVWVKDLVAALKYDSHNNQHLKEMLKRLTTTGVEWNILSKDGKQEWGITTLLAQVTIKDGICTYAYSPVLRKKLFNPTMYARISLSMQNKFSSKHALAIYELCVDYFDAKRQGGETPWMQLKAYRNLCGLKDGEYHTFKRLNTRLIKEPVSEINEKSDIYIEVNYKKEKRSVVAIKFYIKSNPNKGNLMKVQKDPLLGLPTGKANEILYKRLKIYFLLTHSQAENIMRTYAEDYIIDVIDEVERRIKEGKKIDNIAAYTLKALKEDWRPKKSQFEIEKEKVKLEKKKIEDKKLKEQAKQTIKQQNEREKFSQMFNELSEDDKNSIMDEAFNFLKTENNFMYKRYEGGTREGKTLDDMMLVKSSILEYRDKILQGRHFKTLSS